MGPTTRRPGAALDGGHPRGRHARVRPRARIVAAEPCAFHDGPGSGSSPRDRKWVFSFLRICEALNLGSVPDAAAAAGAPAGTGRYARGLMAQRRAGIQSAAARRRSAGWRGVRDPRGSRRYARRPRGSSSWARCCLPIPDRVGQAPVAPEDDDRSPTAGDVQSAGLIEAESVVDSPFGSFANSVNDVPGFASMTRIVCVMLWAT